jgi:uncharacterized membrane protein YcaP (DUF421 family)
MDKAITAFDLQRMLLGDEPLLFLLEIAVRSIVIYGYTLFLLRWIGGRSIGQLSLVEFLLVIALGSAVGDGMFYAEVPLLHCLVVITVVVLLDKALAFVVARYGRLEDMIEGKSVEIIKDGRISWRQMRAKDIGCDELFEQLRLRDVEHLGQVRGAYFETNGLLSVFKVGKKSERPGLSIVPPWDVAEPTRYEAGDTGKAGDFACARCGYVVTVEPQKQLPACPGCEATTWHEAARGGGEPE